MSHLWACSGSFAGRSGPGVYSKTTVGRRVFLGIFGAIRVVGAEVGVVAGGVGMFMDGLKFILARHKST